MKRIAIISVSLLLLIGLLMVLFLLDTHGVRFVSMHSQPIGSYRRIDYDWGGNTPLQDRIWVQVLSKDKTVGRCFLFDVPNRLVVGELLNAEPAFFNRDQSKLLCSGPSRGFVLKFKLFEWLCKLPFASTRSFFQRKARNMIPPESELLFILNVKNGSVTRSMELPFSAAYRGKRLLPSPGFRYAFNWLGPRAGKDGWILCDLENDLFTRVSFDGEALGWWDERTILLEDKKSNLLLFDVVARETSTLLSGQAMSRLLGELELPDDPTALGVISNWNGNGYDFFFALEDEKQSGESFLLKIDRTTKTLKLVNRSFKFQHSGRLDAEGTHYLYQGERSGPRGGGNGAVYLRDLSDGTVRTLVQADNGGKYALARFCASGVMYCRSNRLFWIDLNGRNNVAMFRP